MAGHVRVLARQIGSDESAVCGLPFRLAVTGTLFSVLVLITAASLTGFLDGVKEQEILDEVSKVIATAEQLSLRGEGSEIATEIDVPRRTSVDFGALPGRKSDWPEDANNYCINIGGKSKFYPACAYFANPELNGHLSLGPGRHRLLLSTKIEQESGRLFVLISKTGAD